MPLHSILSQMNPVHTPFYLEDDCLLIAIIALMMEAVSTSETSAKFYQTTRRDIPEDRHLHTRSLENLKSHPFHLFEINFNLPVCVQVS
jgi:hypothetical protein